MPNYQYVIPNTFQPFTMDEMLKPYMIASQVYENTEKQYNELQDKAGKFKYLSETLPEDSKARQIYEGYANDLNKQAESLIRSGLNVNSLNALSQLRGRYSGEIGRIMEADTTKRAQEEEQRKALLQNPTMLFDRRADLTSIDDYLTNSHLGYTPYSGAMLAQQTGQMAQALAKRLKEYGPGKSLDKYTNTWLQKYGYNPDEVLQAIENPDNPGSSKVLSSIVDTVMSSSGITNWKDQNTVAQAYNYARQGLWQAIGQEQVQPFENKGVLTAAEAAANARANEQLELQKREASKTDWMYSWDSKGRATGYAPITEALMEAGYVPDGKGGWKLDQTKKNKKGNGGGNNNNTRVALPSPWVNEDGGFLTGTPKDAESEELLKEGSDEYKNIVSKLQIKAPEGDKFVIWKYKGKKNKIYYRVQYDSETPSGSMGSIPAAPKPDKNLALQI